LRGELLGVTDLFAVFGLPRSAWLDAEEIKQRHHDLMAAGHPDKPSAVPASATLLNEARRTLQNPTLRIRHFLALEFPEYQPAANPQQDWDFFLRIGQATREAAELAAKKSSLSHPLARAALQKETLARVESLRLLKNEIENRLAACNERLKISAGPEVLSSLVEEFAFLQKNETSVREALLALDQGLA
jgi:DnaJ-domain-containing protein 1